MQLTANRFTWLEYLKRNPTNMRHFAIYKSLLRCFIEAEPEMFYWHLEEIAEIFRWYPELALLAAQKNLRDLDGMPIVPLSNRELAMTAIVGQKNNHRDHFPAIGFVSRELQLDREIGIAAMQAHPASVCYVTQELADEFFSDRSRVLQEAREDLDVLRRDSQFNDDKQFYMDIMADMKTPNYPFPILSTASPRIRSDFDVCKRALELDVSNYLDCTCYDVRLFTEILGEHTDVRSKNDFLPPYVRKYENREHFLDKDLCMLIVKNSPESFNLLPEICRADRKIALEGLRHQSCLPFVAAPLATDATLYAEAIEKYASPRGYPWRIDTAWEMIPTKHDENVAIAAIKSGLPPRVVDIGVGSNWSADPEKMAMFVRAKITDLFFSPSKDIFDTQENWPYDNEDTVEATVSVLGCILGKVSARLQDSEKIVRAAFTKNMNKSGSICFPYSSVSRRLMQDNEFVQSLVDLCGVAPIGFGDENVLLENIRSDASLYKEVPFELQNRPDFVIRAVRANVGVLDCISPNLLADPRIMEAACAEKPRQLGRLCPTCLSDRKHTI